LCATPGVYPKVEQQKVASNQQALAILLNVRLGWKGMPADYASLTKFVK